MILIELAKAAITGAFVFALAVLFYITYKNDEGGNEK